MHRCGAASTVNAIIQGRHHFPCIVWHYYVNSCLGIGRYAVCSSSQHSPGQGMNTSPGAGGRRPWRRRGAPACQVPDPRSQEIRGVCKHDHCRLCPPCQSAWHLRCCAAAEAQGPQAPGYTAPGSECNTILTPAPRMILTRRPTVVCTFSCPLHVPRTSHRTTCS